MRRATLILALVLLLSVFSACGKVDTAGGKDMAAMDDEAAATPLAEPSAVPSAEPSEEPTPTPSAEPEPSPLPSFEPVDRNFPDNHWSKNIADAPAVPMDGMSAPDGMVPLNELPIDYSPEQAELDGCYGEYIIDGQRITFGDEILSDFQDNVRNGIPCTVRKFYYALSDIPTIADIHFDGEKTIYRTYTRDTEMQLSYEKVYIEQNITDKFADFAVGYDNDAERALADGCIVYIPDSPEPLGNSDDIWKSFNKKVSNGEKAAIRFFRGNTDPIKAYMIHLEFDGEYFILTMNNDYSGLTSTVYTNLIACDNIDWLQLKKTEHYMLTYSDEATYDYLRKCSTILSEPSLRNDRPIVDYFEVYSITLSDTVRIDDFTAIENMELPDESLLSDQSKGLRSITEDEAKSMTTRALLESILPYKPLIDVTAFNTMKQGMDSKGNYPAIQEFFARPNAYYELVKLRFEAFDEFEMIERSVYSTIFIYYENYVLTGLHAVAEV